MHVGSVCLSNYFYNIVPGCKNRAGRNNYVMVILPLMKAMTGNMKLCLKIIALCADNYILCGKILENLKISYKKCKLENINRFF